MERFIDRVYESMVGNLPEACRIPEVEDAFAGGKLCEVWYSEVLEAYQRICDKLGVSDEADAQIIMRSLMDISKELCYRMYQYGARFGMQE